MKLSELVSLNNQITLSLVENMGEINDETTNALMVLEQNLPAKADGYKSIIDHLKSQGELFKKKAEEFTKLSKSFTTYGESLKGHLKISMIKMEKTELIGNDYYWKIQSNQPSVMIDNEEQVPGKYKTVVQTFKINKDEILTDLKAGIEVPGARLENSQHVRCYLKGVNK
jgi:hypothetical protein